MTETTNGPFAAPSSELKKIASEAIRFWEKMRAAYCGVLVGVVLYNFVKALPASKAILDLDHILVLFLQAVLANVLYSLAYIVDVFVQYSAYRQTWKRMRWILFLIGTVFAAILTRFITMSMFAGH